VGLPPDLPEDVREHLAEVQVRRRRLRLRALSEDEAARIPPRAAEGRRPAPPVRKPFRKRAPTGETERGWRPAPRRDGAPPTRRRTQRRDEDGRPSWSPSSEEAGQRRRATDDEAGKRPLKRGHRKGPGPTGAKKKPKRPKGKHRPPWMRDDRD
jgi:hypothetical protein